MTEENQTDIEYMENAVKFLLDGGKFDSIVILASKMSEDGKNQMRYKQVAGNMFACIGMAELYLREEYKE